MISTAWWPSSWNCRSFRSGTVWPRCTSMPVGSMPYLTRSGLPVAMLRWSFFVNSSAGVIWSAPRRKITSCSSKGSMAISPSLGERVRERCGSETHSGTLRIHLQMSNSLEGVGVILDLRFLGRLGPGQGDDVEPSGHFLHAVPLHEVNRQPGQSLLFARIDRNSSRQWVNI